MSYVHSDDRLPDLEKEFLEKLAELEHEQWVSWARGLCVVEGGISLARRMRWESLFVPYRELPEEEKEKDREWARKVFELVKRHVDD